MVFTKNTTQMQCILFWLSSTKVMDDKQQLHTVESPGCAVQGGVQLCYLGNVTVTSE